MTPKEPTMQTTTNGHANGHAERLPMPSTKPAGVDPVFAALAQVRAMFAPAYPDFDWYLVGQPRRSGLRPIRLLCPDLNPPPPPPPEEGSNADLIRQVLDEADRPLTVVELAFRATGGEPSGAFRKALRKMVAAGDVSEIAGPPKTYES